jgi:preprotein translocase subunit SecE
MTTTTHEEAGRELTPKTLGLTRWVQMAFVAFWLLLVWVLDKVVTIVWDKFSEPQPLVVTAGALVVGGAVALTLYRNEKVHRIANEVVGELAKVTWPSRKETQVATVVVIITSLIAAAIIGVFDATWSWLTDFIYKV